MEGTAYPHFHQNEIYICCPDESRTIEYIAFEDGKFVSITKALEAWADKPVVFQFKTEDLKEFRADEKIVALMGWTLKVYDEKSQKESSLFPYSLTSIKIKSKLDINKYFGISSAVTFNCLRQQINRNGVIFKADLENTPVTSIEIEKNKIIPIEDAIKTWRLEKTLVKFTLQHSTSPNDFCIIRSIAQNTIGIIDPSNRSHELDISKVKAVSLKLYSN